jgi:DNA-binding beta-propeller fold protein YncE
MMRTRLLLAVLAFLPLAACGDKDSSSPLKVPELEYGIDEPWPSPGSLPPIGPAGRIVITNNLDDTLSLLDLDTMDSPGWGELARIPVGLNPVEQEGPHHTVASPDGAFYYVGISNFVPGAGSGPHGAHGAGTSDGYCLKLDSTTNRLVGSVRVDPNPGDVIVSKDGRTLYQTHFDLLKIAEVAKRGGSEEEMHSRMAILDAETMTRKEEMVKVCPAPHAVRLSLDGRRAYIACWSDEVAIVELEQPGRPVTRVKVAANAGNAVSPRHEPYALTVSPTTGAVWVSSLASRSVQYLDPATLTMDPNRTVFLAGPPLFGAFTRDGRTLYMPFQNVDAIAIIDPASSTVQENIPLAPSGCLNVHQVELTPDERHALVVCEGDHVGPGTFHVVSLAEKRVVKTVQVGIFPDSVTLLRRQP